MAALVDPVELTRHALRPCRRCGAAERARTRRCHRRHRDRRNQQASKGQGHSRAVPASPRIRPSRPRRRAVEPIPARARYRPTLARRRPAGGNRGISRLRLSRHGDGDASGRAGGTRHGAQRVRGRGRGPDRSGPAGCRRRNARAHLQSPERPTGPRIGAHPVSTAQERRRDRRPSHELRERERMDLKFIIQVDTLCHKIPNFIVKAARAGVTRVFIGLENINPANLLAAKKRQNKITEYRRMLLDWKNARVITYCGYSLGFPAETPQSIREDIEIIKRDLPVDILEFFCLTPLPGSEDHKVLWQMGAWMDPDMNKYDLEHVVADHARMSREEWAAIYRSAWDAYYTPEHIETIMRRAAAAGMGLSRLAAVLFFFSTCLAVENVHPLQGGVLRLKYRRDRRPGLAVEPAWAFYPKYAWEVLTKHARILKHWLALDRMRRRLQRDPQRRVYSDQALMPVTEEESDTLELFTHNEAARVEVERIRKIAELTRPDRGAPQTQHG